MLSGMLVMGSGATEAGGADAMEGDGEGSGEGSETVAVAG